MATVTPTGIIVPDAAIPFDLVGAIGSFTGNIDSPNVADRKGLTGRRAVLSISTTVGATPTVVPNLNGSIDGTTFYQVPYAVPGTPGTIVGTAPAAITSATTTFYLLAPDAWRFFKVTLSANTNVTVTAIALLIATQ